MTIDPTIDWGDEGREQDDGDDSAYDEQEVG